jgi:predicted RNase H-like HicB family nuclease
MAEKGSRGVQDKAMWSILYGEVKMKYKILLRKTDEGYSVSVPGLPGCWSQGETEAEALENIQVAIQEYLAARDDLLKGEEIREVEVTG